MTNKDIKRGAKVKLVVSFNGEFRHHSPSRKLRYVGGATKVIYIDPFITFVELKSRIHELGVFVNELLLLYTTHFSFCENMEMGYTGCDDDVRRMIREVEDVESVGRSCRLCVFACCNENGVCLDSFDVKNWVFACKNENGECLNSYSDVKNWVYGECLSSCSDGKTCVFACKKENFECLNSCSDSKTCVFACKKKYFECLNSCSVVKNWGYGECLSSCSDGKKVVFACKNENGKCLDSFDGNNWVFACKNENGVCLNSCSDCKKIVFACKNKNGECLDSFDGNNWVFACNNENGECLNSCSDVKKIVFACKDENGVCLNSCSDVKNWVFEEGNFGVNSEESCGDYGVLRENPVTQLTKSEKDWNFIDCSMRKFSVSEELVSGNELDKIEFLNDCCLEENGVNLMSGNECCDGSNDDSNLSFQKKNSEIIKIIESKCSNGIDEENSKSGNTSVASSDSSLLFNTNEKENKSREGLIRKDQDKDASASSKAYGRMSAEIVSCYNHLESIELQTIKYTDIEFIKQLGEGAYGVVYYGKWNRSDVAIKRVKFNCSTEGTLDEDRLVKDFWNEARMLGKLHHPNIVALYGVVTDGPPKYLAAATEYMVNGSLKQVLRRRDRTIDRRKRVIIASDTASGMEYLHENNIVHFDLKSHNLLVNMRDPLRPVCKIGDLGLSKIKQRSIVSGGFRGTLPWMAPELFDPKSMVTEKVDVYSFAIVMWELLTGETPYANMRSEEIIAGMMKGDLRPEIPSWCDPVWRSLMERCWLSDPVTRPSFIDIVKELKTMAVSMNIK